MRQIIGSKGGGGGTSFVTKPDTLRSNDSFEILLGLGSGRWKGMVNGLKSLKINGVPMENADGSSNFKEIFAVFADGNPLQDQIVSFKLGGGGSVAAVNTQLANPNTGIPGPWVSAATGTLNADFIDIRFVVQQLFYQDTKSIRENTAHIEIEMRPSGTSTWINPFTAPVSNTVTYDASGYDYYDGSSDANYRLWLGRDMFNSSGTGFVASNTTSLIVTGKTTSAYVKELRIQVPNQGAYANKTWEIRARLVEKDTIDNGDIQERRIIVFESVSAVLTEPLGDHPDWDGLVWLQLYGKASDQFNGFPEVTSVCDTKICAVPPPAVFDPEARTYTTATWDGSYVEAFTTDPAWQIKEFIEDPIHGLAGLQPGTTLDKWDCLEASKYYSELVPDGKGGFHPRFNMNITINEARETEEMLGFLAGAVNSYIEEVSQGEWRLKVDKPETPTMLFTEDNIFGEFEYSHTDVDTRFNDWRGTFLDEDLDYATNTVRVFDQDDIDNYGMKFTEVALVGCTNRQEALRRLMFRLRVSLNEYKVVNFTTNRMGRFIAPLSTILIADGGLNADYLVKSTSRLAYYSGTTAHLKRPVRLEIGVTYQISFTTNDKEIITRTVLNSSSQRGDVTELLLDSALPDGIMEESAVALTAVGLPSNPLSYRVVAVERGDGGEDQYVITAIIVDSGKWNAMDNVSEEEIEAQESQIFIDPPTVPDDGMFQVLLYATDFELKRVIQVNWNRPGGMYLDGFRVEYRINDGPYRLAVANLKDSVFELENPEDGIYDFKITALDRRGVESSPLIGRYDFVGSRETRAPTHVRGTTAGRPTTAPYDGFRYTPTDTTKPVTSVWEDGAWVEESTHGMTPAEAATMDTIIVDIDDILVDIDDLFDIYGDTISAGEAADAAAAAQAAAEAAAAASAISATNAGNSATSASGSAAVATAQAAGAATSATNAATSATNAGTSATAASTSASSAGTSATNSAASATAANSSAVSASASAGSASTSASSASSSAAGASSSAASALNSSIIAASVNTAALNKSPTFSDNANATGAPTNWDQDGNFSGATLTRIAGPNGVGYSFRMASAAGNNAYTATLMDATIIRPNAYYVMEADIFLHSGTLNGSGLYTSNAGMKIEFAVDKDDTGAAPGTGTTGRNYRFRKLVQAPSTTDNGTGTYLYVMSHWSGFSTPISVANDITFIRALIRPATQLEITQGRAGGLESSVAQISGALASSGGSATAFWQVQANAGTATTFITAQSNTSQPTAGPISVAAGAYALAQREYAHDGLNLRRLAVDAGSGWTFNMVSNETYTGYAYVSWQAGSKVDSQIYMLGLTDNAASSGLGDLDYGWYLNGSYFGSGLPGGDVRIDGSGSGTPTTPAWNETTFFELIYNQDVAGGTVWWKRDGAVIHSVTGVGTGRTFRLAAYLYYNTVVVPHVAFGQKPPIVASTLGLGANEVHIYNPVSSGWKKVLSIVSGNVNIDGNLTVTSGIYLGSGIPWQLGLAAKNFLVTDGTSLSYGYDLGNTPNFRFNGDNLAPLTSGETYQLYVEGATPTGATIRLKISTPGSTTPYSLTTDSAPGTGPTRQIDKGSDPDATSNVYTFRVIGTWTGAGTFESSGYWPYEGSVEVGIWAYKASTWVMMSTAEVPITGFFTTGGLHTHDFDHTESFDLGPGVAKFGVTMEHQTAGSSAAVTDLYSVSWSYTAVSGTRSATPSGQLSTVTVIPI